jgi:PleD family two-component response regulator
MMATISAGVASWAPSATDGGPEALMQRADRALYRAKDDGRNAAVCASRFVEAAAERPSAA